MNIWNHLRDRLGVVRLSRNSILSRLNDTSKLTAVNTNEYTFMWLDTDSLNPSKENFYGIREIEALADNMLTAGNIEPIIVGKVDGEYRIISGHRRWHAVMTNKQRGHEKFNRIACMVKEMSYNMFMFTLISANAFNRKFNDYELVKQAELLKQYTTKLVREDGLEIHGKMRDYLAETLGVSNTKMAQIDSINNNLSEEGKEALKKGEINFSKAYQTSRLPEKKQHEVITNDKLLSGGVKDIVREMKSGKGKASKNEKKDKIPPKIDTKQTESFLNYTSSQIDTLSYEMERYLRFVREESSPERKEKYEIIYQALKHYHTHCLEAKNKDK